MTRTILANGVDLPVEIFGAPLDPAVLLIGGTGSSMDVWRDDLVEALVAGGARVIRFDQRDTGLAPADPVGRPGYTLRDLVDDAAGLLDTLGIARAHWVGFAQGGWVAQLAALEHPEVVASLTLIATRPVGHGPTDPDLPDLADRIIEAFADAPAPPAQGDHGAWLDYLVSRQRPFASVRVPFDDADAFDLAATVVGRTRSLLSSIGNHHLADQGDRWRERLGEIHVPTTVLHGDDDPLFPLGNAEALAHEIPGAELRILEDVGHELPPRARPLVAEAILETVMRAVVVSAR